MPDNRNVDDQLAALREELRKCEVKCLREGLVAAESEAAVMREALLRFTPERMQSATDYINYQDWRARTAALATNSGKSLLDELTALRARWCDAHSTNDTKPGPCPACEIEQLRVLVEKLTVENEYGLGELADADAEDDPEPETVPIGKCRMCGTPVYTDVGFCGTCRNQDGR